MSASSLREKEVEWRLQDPEPAADKPVEYEPIRTETSKLKAEEADLEANTDMHGRRRTLSRLQSRNSGYSEFSDVASVKSTQNAKKKWYRRLNPLKWGSDPPIPTSRGVSREYNASFFSRLTFEWMSPLMTVSKAQVSKRSRPC